jgi:hypothetical protein
MKRDNCDAEMRERKEKTNRPLTDWILLGP